MADGSYQVLARKWRPQKFEQVVGQAAIVRTLSNALEQGRVAHAYCFSGIRGVGKTTIARLLAKGLNCRNVEAPTAEPCGECDACVEIEESRNMDVIELDAASQTGVDSIRQLNEVARYTPSRDRYRVFIIDEAHMLSTSAFNALLKTLEEPPPHIVFMLATTEPHKILPTVLSRCQHYPLGRISQAEITEQLKRIVAAENVSLSDDGLAMVAIAADGSLRDAQSLLDKLIAFGGDEVDDETVVSLLGMVDRELLFGAAELIAQQDLAGILGFVNRMVEQGTDLHQFTLDLLGHLRALLVVATVKEAGEILHLPDGDLARLQEQAKLFGVDDLDRGFALLSASEYRIKQSEVPRYQLEMVLSRLARMPRLEPIEDLIAQLRSGSGGGDGGGSGPQRPGGPDAGGGDANAARAVTGRSGDPDSPSVPATAPAPSESDNGADSRSAPEAPATPPPSAEPGDVGAAVRPEGNGAPLSANREVAGGNGSEAAPTQSAPSTLGGDIGLIVDRLRQEKPMIAQIIERADAAELRDDTLFLTFEKAGGIFQARLNDQSALGTIEDAAEAALGRKIKVVAGIDATVGGEPAPDPAAQASDPEGPARQQRDELWQRAEGEPMVKHFVDALRGNLTDVEEI